MNRRIIATIVSIAILAWVQGAAGAGLRVPVLCCGDVVVTQSNDTSVIEFIPTHGNGVYTAQNAYARCFSSAEFPADFLLHCVEFGVFQNTSPTGADFNVELRIVRLLQTTAFPGLSCPLPDPAPAFGDPQLGNPWFNVPPEFEVLHLQSVRIPDQFSGLMGVTLSPPLQIPAGADILVEVHATSRNPGVGGDGGAFFLGGNEANPVGGFPTLWWEPFALVDYKDMVSIDPTFTGDWVVLLEGTSGPIPPPAIDCNANGVLDACETDCNANGIPDDCDVDPLDPDGNGQVSPDCNANGVPDECETDCNTNGVPDDCDVDPLDPDGNGQVSPDCNANGVPDECETDCNANGIPDDCDVDPLDPDGDGQVSPDSNGNGIPDECDPDCNANGIPDDLDIDMADPDGNGLFSTDCNANGIPDECDLDPADPDGNGQVSADCQLDAIPDECQTAVFSYLIDDGTSESSAGLANGGSVAWMNHFTVNLGSETIGQLRLAWSTVANGTPATVYLWSDPNGDGNPTDAQVLASAVTTVQNAGTNLFTDVTIPNTFVGPLGTSFFAGAILAHQAGENPIPLDSASPMGQTWLVADGASQIGPNDLAAAEFPPFAAANGVALVRAVAPGDDCNSNGVPDICEGSNDVAIFIGEVIAAVPNPLLTCIFDRNGDGKVDGQDIQLFVDVLLSGL